MSPGNTYSESPDSSTSSMDMMFQFTCRSHKYNRKGFYKWYRYEVSVLPLDPSSSLQQQAGPTNQMQNVERTSNLGTLHADLILKSSSSKSDQQASNTTPSTEEQRMRVRENK